MLEKEHTEALAADLSEDLGRQLLSRVRSGEATAAEMRVALDYIKHHGVTDDPSRPGSPVRSVEDAVNSVGLPPFDSVDQELQN